MGQPIKTKLEPVTLTRSDTCFTYALKRSRWFMSNYWSSEEYIEKNCDLEEVFSDTDFRLGDILVYYMKDGEKVVVEVANHIDEDCKVTWDDVEFNKHFMVYEGKGMISEAVLEYNKMFSIQVRSMAPYLKNYTLYKLIPPNYNDLDI